MPVQPQYSPETKILCRTAQRCVEQGRGFWWTKHGLQSLDEGCSTDDYEKMLTICQVTLVENKKDVLWRAEGTDVDGMKLVAVVAVYEERVVIKIVTTFIG